MYAIARPSVCRLSVCNVRAPYSGDWNFRQCFDAIWYLLNEPPLIFESLVRYSLLHFHLSHMAVHDHLLHHLCYHHLHLLRLVQSFILNLRLGSSANPFLHRPFPHLPDWFYELSDHLMFLFCSTAGFVSMVCNTKPALSRFSNAIKIIATFIIHAAGR